MINLQELNVFIEAALAQNFSVAARRLYLSQPAVSLRISNLEKQFGLELFRRNGRSIQLSAAGQVLLPLAQEAMRHVKQIEETMGSLKGVLIGELAIACSTTIGKYVLPRLVAGFRRRHPEVRVTVNTMSRRAAIDWLQAGRAAMAVVSARLDHVAELEYQDFLEDEIILIAPADHPWADGRTVAPSDLLNVPFILREPTASSYEVLLEGLNQHGLDIGRLRVALTLTNAEAIEMSVEAGIGVAFISRMAAERGLALGRIVRVPVAEMSLARRIYMVRNTRHTITPLGQAFWSFVLAEEHEELRQLSDAMQAQAGAAVP
ncbi:MAG: HTH-type transcriptional activator CmpR [Chloroflexi bacterium ADurb.Bin325]|nr:MAG: HTH-type transcriptional activator CmpR [Chloroflexi bacterium ADurb.Bin325]